MDLIERYLHAVKEHLPLAQQQDVIEELGDDLRSRIEERESAIGRPLVEDEVVAILKQLGRPMILAGRYRPRQQLIGPAMLPYFWQTLKIALGIALIVQIVLGSVMAASGRSIAESFRGVFSFPLTAVTIFGWVTLAFTLLDTQISRVTFEDSWNPRDLPKVPAGGVGGSALQTAFGVVTTGVMLAWWLAVPSRPYLLLGPAAAFVQPGPGWHAVYLPIAALWLLSAAVQAVALWRRDLRLHTRIGANVIALGGIAVLAMTRNLLVLVPSVPSPEKMAKAIAWIEGSIMVGLAVSAVIVIIELVRDVRRLRQWKQARPVAAAASTRPGSPR
jgi:hypothetical protein